MFDAVMDKNLAVHG